MPPASTAASEIPLLHVVVGLISTVLLGFGVLPLLDYAKKSMPLPPPNEATAEQWSKLVSGNEGGAVLGHLERFLFFAVFLAGAPLAAGAWLAFKVASKWNAWENILAIPSKLDGIEDLDFLNARRHWGSHVLMTFLIGTAYNLICGLLGAALAGHLNQILKSFGF